jgi:hypothetical protein
MNKYLIPVCDIQHSNVYILCIYANSYNHCKEKIIERFSRYSDKDDYEEFIKDLDKKDILIGSISDIEEF